jgi:crossover junction endodeoxyribonuclease RuvC
VGYAVVDRNGSQMTAVTFGLIQTPRVELNDRLRLIHDQVRELMVTHRPDALATERLLFTVNKTTAMDVARALGCIQLAASFEQIPWHEYSPPEIKKAVVGTGAADKKQVQFMVTRLLSLKETPKPDDVADAIAIAITHAFISRVKL